MIYKVKSEYVGHIETFYRSYLGIEMIRNVSIGVVEYRPTGNSIKTITQVKAYGLNDFQSDVGGTIGLFIGLSIYSLVEFIAEKVKLILDSKKHMP